MLFPACRVWLQTLQCLILERTPEQNYTTIHVDFSYNYCKPKVLVQQTIDIYSYFKIGPFLPLDS